MTRSNHPSAASLNPAYPNEPHFGDLRKGAFLQRLRAYRARADTDASLARYRYADTDLAPGSIVT